MEKEERGVSDIVPPSLSSTKYLAEVSSGRKFYQEGDSWISLGPSTNSIFFLHCVMRVKLMLVTIIYLIEGSGSPGQIFKNHCRGCHDEGMQDALINMSGTLNHKKCLRFQAGMRMVSYLWWQIARLTELFANLSGMGKTDCFWDTLIWAVNLGNVNFSMTRKRCKVTHLGTQTQF